MCTERRRWSTIAVAVLLAVAGCTSTATRSEQASTPTKTSIASSRSTGTTTSSAPSDGLQASFAELAGTVAATIGIAIAPLGTDTVSTFGSWSTGVAWSTIKVPLVIAAQRAGVADADTLATRAITESDNAAAEQLWSELGSGDPAAQQVQSILVEGGDTSTVVQSQRVRPPYTPFGQTQWPLGQQALFAAHLPCLADAEKVIDLMHQVTASQRWGLAANGSAAKGGWGPDDAGNYLVRQFGIISTPAGDLGVALAAEPNDGSFDTGVSALDQMTAWLTAHTTDLPGGHCPT